MHPGHARITPATGASPAAPLSAGTDYDIQFAPATLKEREPGRFRIKCHTPQMKVKGWFLPPAGQEIHGLRLSIGEMKVTARRKQVQTEALEAHPDRIDALLSGFSAEFELKPGKYATNFEYKDAAKQWIPFATCELKLSRLWKLKKAPATAATFTNKYHDWARDQAALTTNDVTLIKSHVSRMQSPPLLSILMPVYNTPEVWLRQAIESVRAQYYQNWELCIADDASTAPHVRKVLLDVAGMDSRIRVSFRTENGHICHSSNTALEMCRGEYTVLMDHDDELPPEALYFMAAEIQQYPKANLIFSDEDKIDESGVLSDPYFKTGWDPDLFLLHNLVCHLAVFRTAMLREIGGFRPGFEGAQDWDLTLRFSALCPPGTIRHIPRVLYHWRTLPTSTALSQGAKPYALAAGEKAVAAHLAVHHPGAFMAPLPDHRWRIAWPLPESLPLVSIIIPTKDRLDLLRVAIQTLLEVTTYPNFEIVIVDHASVEPATLDYFQEIAAHDSRIRVVRTDGPFNWSRLNNFGRSHSRGEILLFLNNDVEIRQPDWLHEMVAQVSRPGIGAVGAALIYPSGLLQHAGVVFGMTSIAGHVFRGQSPVQASHNFGPTVVREVSAVTGACLAVQRKAFDEVGGFDEVELAIGYNDLDFCLKLRSIGLRNIYTPHAQVIHHESASRAEMEKQSARKAMASAEAIALRKRWPVEAAHDACFNPNYSLDSELPVPGKPAKLQPWLGGS